ncbi:tetratricopeptide repeat protein [Nitrospirillum viridazoti]|uniref:Type II protein arginine methyltransferase n=1 Tax=Nitrospirillum amazonense TaxID=28077 RepID=A0A560HS93_9PROT|nr:tetratricopeptide repeat protein [Nitrospirillum amazonense]TWB48831.1 type II protein arginine methyltransferase [Nitrospirillum amazonense]
MAKPPKPPAGPTVPAEELFAQGVEHQNQGRWAEAEAVYREVARMLPRASAVHWNLGTVRKHLGQWKEALDAFRKAVSLDPTWRGRDFNIGLCHQKLGHTNEAAESFARAVAAEPDDPINRFNLAAALRDLGRLAEAVVHTETALELKPDFIEAELQLAKLRTALTPRWHVPMMNDVERNAAYEAAITAAVRPGDIVLEIGTGSGLLAMMAARAGAAQVYTCEADPVIAETARAIIATNGYADRVTVIAKPSGAVTVGKDLPRPADLLVSEILSSDLLSERVLPAVRDARDRLLTPEARIIPQAGGVRALLAESRVMERAFFVEEACGFDLDEFNRLAPRAVRLDRIMPFRPLSAPFQALTVDLADPQPGQSWRGHLAVPVTADGRCVGLLQWIWLKLWDGVEFENSPLIPTEASGWQPGLYLPRRPLDLMAGETVEATSFHDGHNVWLSLKR